MWNILFQRAGEEREEKERERETAELNLTRVSMTGVLLERCMSVLELSPLYRKWK